MIEAYAMIDSNNETVFKVGDDIFSSIEEIFKDEDVDYLGLDAVEMYNFVQNIRDDALDFLYPEEVSTGDIEDALDEYIESIGDDVLDVSYENGTCTYIRNGNKHEIKGVVLDILKERIDG